MVASSIYSSYDIRNGRTDRSRPLTCTTEANPVRHLAVSSSDTAE
jgi:hypothetical protein